MACLWRHGQPQEVGTEIHFLKKKKQSNKLLFNTSWIHFSTFICAQVNDKESSRNFTFRFSFSYVGCSLKAKKEQSPMFFYIGRCKHVELISFFLAYLWESERKKYQVEIEPGTTSSLFAVITFVNGDISQRSKWLNKWNSKVARNISVVCKMERRRQRLKRNNGW